MKYKYLSLVFLFVVSAQLSHAQPKVNLKAWLSAVSDSLLKKNIDTVLYYHRFCFGCAVPNNGHNFCNTGESTTQLENVIVFKKNGRYAYVQFDCSFSCAKTDMKGSEALPYFISIQTDLDVRDQEQKQHRITFPAGSDGVFEEATLLSRKGKQKAAMSHYAKITEEYSAFLLQHPWAAKQAELFKLIREDLAASGL